MHADQRSARRKRADRFLVPPNDANELAHAILAALFKPEVAQQKIDAARQTREKFRPRRRLGVLTQIYESLHR